MMRALSCAPYTMLCKTKLYALPALFAAFCSVQVLAASSSCLIDLESGQTILAENENAPTESNATSALMTVYTALSLAKERGESLDHPLNFQVAPKRELPKAEVLKSSNTKTDKSQEKENQNHKAQPSESVSNSNIADAVEAVLLAADQEALQALVRHFAKDDDSFVERMNELAKQIGMQQSTFKTPFPNNTTLKNRTSVSDTAILSISLYKDFPFSRIWTSEDSMTFNNREIRNKNFFRTNSSAVKGVFTHLDQDEASGVILAEDTRSNGRTRQLLAVVLKEDNRKALQESISALLLRGWRDYETIRLYKGGDIVGSVPVYKGDQAMLPLKSIGDIFVTLTKERMLEKGKNAVDIAIEYKQPLVAPLDTNNFIGTLVVSVDGQIITRSKLVAAQKISRGNFLRRLTDTIKLALNGNNFGGKNND